MASTKASITIDFTGCAVGDSINGIIIDGVGRIINCVAGSPTTWDFVIGATDNDTANNFRALIQANSSSYIYFPYLTSVQIEAISWGASWNFSTLITSGGINVTAQVDNNVDPLSNSYTTVNNLCFGAATGSIDLTPINGAYPYTYAWDDGPTTQDRSALPAGTYTVTITDTLSNTSIAVISITEPPSGISSVETLTHIDCNGAANGAISLVVSGGASPYTYAWDDGPTTKDRSGLAPGTYGITITDSNSCIEYIQYVITEPPALQILAAINGRDIDITVSGGTPGYVYQWADGPQTEDRVDLEPATYTIVVTDAKGCTKQADITIDEFHFYFSKNPVELALTALDPGTKPNLSFLCEVWVEDSYLSNTFSKVIEIEQPADVDGSTVFDVQEILDSYLKEQLPAFNENTIQLATGHFVRFYMRHTEKHGTPPAPSTYTQIETYYILLGGLSDEEHAAGTFMNIFLTGQQPFYTWEPIEREVFTDEQAFLHFMVNKFTVGQLLLKGKVYYSNNTDSLVSFLVPVNSPNKFEVYRFPAGYTQLDIANVDPAKTVVKYELWVEDDLANVLTEHRIFTVKAASPYCRSFLYLNSLGGWNTLSTDGNASAKMKVSEETLNTPLPPQFTVNDSEVTVVNKIGERSEKIYAKFVDDASYLIDFAISPAVFEIKNGRYVPVRIQCDPDIFNDERGFIEFDFTVIPERVKMFTPPL